jgi:hypothetical protein
MGLICGPKRKTSAIKTSTMSFLVDRVDHVLDLEGIGTTEIGMPVSNGDPPSIPMPQQSH